MKWLFLLNDVSCLAEFLGKLAEEVIKQGDECLVVWNSKIAEYGRKQFFPKEAKSISKIDWCADNYQPNKKEFGDLSWKEIFPVFERFSFWKLTYNNALKISSHLYQLFDFIFKKERPDAIVGEIPADIFHETAHYFGQKNNTPYLGIEGAKFKNRIDIYDSKFVCLRCEKTFSQSDIFLSKEEKDFAEKFVKDFISHKLVQDYADFGEIHLSQFGVVKHYLKRMGESGSLLWRYLKERKYFKEFDYESEAILKKALRAPWGMEKRQFRIWRQKNVFPKIEKYDENFFFFPLHFEPESSTSIYATYYADQLNTIRNIAFSLPLPYKLYVKEHPASVGRRPGSFYKKLKAIPNVVLVGPDENVEEIIKKSRGVVVLTGTIGMEAALSGKPAYVLGTVYYSYHPLCRKVKNFEDLKNKINKDLANRPDISSLKDINCRFIASYFRNTIAGNIGAASAKKDINDYQQIRQNLKSIAQEIKDLKICHLDRLQ